MKRSKYIIFPCLFSLCLTGCWEKREKPATEKPYERTVNDVQGETQDKVLVGHLGEETAMSSLQVITDAGDTVAVSKTSADGVEGTMLGEVRNYEDRVMLVVKTDEEENCFLSTFLNVSQLEGEWKNNDSSLKLQPDSTVSSRDMKYSHWRVEKCKLLLVADRPMEYGQTQHVDTASISLLNEDSLHISIPRHGILKLGK